MEGKVMDIKEKIYKAFKKKKESIIVDLFIVNYNSANFYIGLVFNHVINKFKVAFIPIDAIESNDKIEDYLCYQFIFPKTVEYILDTLNSNEKELKNKNLDRSVKTNTSFYIELGLISNNNYYLLSFTQFIDREFEFLFDIIVILFEHSPNIMHELCSDLLEQFNRIKPENDLKLISLAKIIENKIENPINDDNKKVIIFSAFADTANYIYTNLAPIIKDKYDLETALVTGSGQNKCTLKTSTDFNELLSLFSPMSKRGKEVADEMKVKGEKQIDLLIATDCISEGQNLQDCDFLINYDIHWNPVRIIQRFGRIDRIGSKNKVIQLVNFWPNMKLDDYINLKNRVEDRMALTDISATGEDNVLTNESNDMEYRKAQLQKLKDEVVDLEDMDTGVSITDLGLNDFRMDLLEYTKTNGNIDSVANGMHAVVKSDEINGIDKGVIFVLKNINSNVNIKNTNQLHPFYIIYIGEDGSILSNHLNVKNTLDILRLICKDKSEPIKDAYEKFNQETNDGNDMNKYSELLNQSIDSIIHIKEESDIDSLFRRGGTTMLENDITGIDDFELIAFVAIV